MSARALLRLTGDADALLIPRDALIRYPDGTITVFVVDDSTSPARVSQRGITIGRVDGDMAVVESGLEPGRPVVVRGNEVLTDGDAVRVVTE
jgi:multidrug efflux pump subunit AcrA (membrane-fusion protein)